MAVLLSLCRSDLTLTRAGRVGNATPRGVLGQFASPYFVTRSPATLNVQGVRLVSLAPSCLVWLATCPSTEGQIDPLPCAEPGGGGGPPGARWVLGGGGGPPPPAPPRAGLETLPAAEDAALTLADSH